MNLEAGLAVFAILLAVYGGIGILLGRWSITMPMVFVIIGVLVGPYGFGLLPIKPGDEAVRTLTELTLALLLFGDASTIDFGRLRHDAHLPLRLLSIGLPLTWLGCCFRPREWGLLCWWPPFWRPLMRRWDCRSLPTQTCRCASAGR
jgi:Kef-type K+ transport system membrane component KefB